MVRYRRNFVEGGTYFFTLTLRDRWCEVISGGTGRAEYPDVAIGEANLANERPVYPFGTSGME